MNIHSLYFSLFPQSTSLTARAHGIDLSKYDLYFLPETAAGQLDFVVQRASYGLTQDERFNELLIGVKQVGIRGAYHYLSSGLGWQAQADKYLSIVSPHDYHFHVCDFEGAYNTLSTAFAKRAWDWIAYVRQKTGKPVLLYTGKYIYQDYITPSGTQYGIDWNTVPLWIAQYPFAPVPDGTPSLPAGRNNWTLWQYTDKGNSELYGTGAACDLDVYHGTPAELKQWLAIPPSADVISYPHPGMKRVSGTRHGWKFELFINDPARVRFESICLFPIETVSSVAKRKGATLVVNGGEPTRDGLTLKDYAVSNGLSCHERVFPQPSLMVMTDNSIVIDHKPTASVRQALSGLRYLIENGVIKDYLSGTEPQYTEGHARSIHGKNAAGHHMVLQSEGAYPNQGLTLKQGAEIFRQYEAVIAFDSGGGGDVSCYFDGQVLIKPENIVNGQNVERPLPQVFLIYANGGSMQYQVTWDTGVTKRLAPTTSSLPAPIPNVYPDNKIVDVMQDNIPDQTYPTDVNKIWVKFPDGTFGASKYGSVRMVLVTPPPEPIANPKATVTFTDPAGKVFEAVDIELKPKP